MVPADSEIRLPDLSPEQEAEGYWLEQSGSYVLVWHYRNQIALLALTPDIGRKVDDIIEKRRAELRDIEAKTGWKSTPPPGWTAPSKG